MVATLSLTPLHLQVAVVETAPHSLVHLLVDQGVVANRGLQVVLHHHPDKVTRVVIHMGVLTGVLVVAVVRERLEEPEQHRLLAMEGLVQQAQFLVLRLVTLVVAAAAIQEDQLAQEQPLMAAARVVSQLLTEMRVR